MIALLNILVAVLISPLFMTFIKKVKAWAQRRQGPPLLQGYYTFMKLLKKETVLSTNSSWIMRWAAPINLAVMIIAALFIPIVGIGGSGNILLFLYLLALAKFFMALAGLDAGSTFGGMGSSREMTISAVIEPVTVIVFAALAYVLGTMDIHRMALAVLANGPQAALVLISMSLFIILIVETARVPVDNPETHLELTMVHEAMILEQSGKNLAFMELAHAIKQTLLMGLLMSVLFPYGLATETTLVALVFGISAFIVKGLCISFFVGLFESSMAKSRLFLLPNLFMLAYFFSFLTILFEVFA